MSRVSTKNWNKLAGETISILREHDPLPLSTRQIAAELVRDKEFCLRLLLFLKEKGYVTQRVKKNGAAYVRWCKWSLSDAARQRFG